MYPVFLFGGYLIRWKEMEICTETLGYNSLSVFLLSLFFIVCTFFVLCFSVIVHILL